MLDLQGTNVQPEHVPIQEIEPQQFGAVERLKRVGAYATLAAAGFTGGAIYGAMSPANVTLGPHEATVQVIAADELQIDLGPLGELSVESHTPIGGVKVVVKEVPDGDGATADQSEAKQYTQFFSEPERQTMQHEATWSIAKHALTYGGIGAGSALLGGWAIGRRGRQATKDVLQSRRLQAVLGVGLSLGILTGSSQIETSKPFAQDPFLASIGLPGVHMDGKLLEIIASKFGPDTIGYLHNLDDYYREIETNVQTAYDAKLAQEATISPAASQKETEDAVWISDNHCNTQTASIAAGLANKISAVFVLDSGDQTMGGTAAERPCAAALPNRLDDGIPMVVSLGNHDSRDVTAKMDKDLGYKVLDSTPIEVNGYRFLGDSDVNRSEFNVPFHQVGPESTKQQAARLADAAAKAGDIDIAMTHEPETGNDIAQRTLAKLVLAGHTHVFRAPTTTISPDGTEATYQMVNGTTGGAAPNKMTFESRLGKDATIVILRFDKQTKSPIAYRTIVMHPDKTVQISNMVPFAPNVPPYVRGTELPR
jgi:hypothetical protein